MKFWDKEFVTSSMTYVLLRDWASRLDERKRKYSPRPVACSHFHSHSLGRDLARIIRSECRFPFLSNSGSIPRGRRSNRQFPMRDLRVFSGSLGRPIKKKLSSHLVAQGRILGREPPYDSLSPPPYFILYDWPSVQGDRCAFIRDSTTTVILSELRSATIVGASRFGLSIEELILQHGKEKVVLYRFSLSFLKRCTQDICCNNKEEPY